MNTHFGVAFGGASEAKAASARLGRWERLLAGGLGRGVSWVRVMAGFDAAFAAPAARLNVGHEMRFVPLCAVVAVAPESPVTTAVPEVRRPRLRAVQTP